MSDVKRWLAMYQPLGSLASPEVSTMVLASDYDALRAKLVSDWRSRDLKLGEVEKLKAENARLRETLRCISTGVKRMWREGEGCYQVAIIADAALSAVPSDSPADVKTVARRGSREGSGPIQRNRRL